MDTIYKYDDYKSYVKDALGSLGHGARIKFASALKCQSAYITQVLNKDSHLSLEQAADASLFLNLNKDEEDYFLLLVQHAKAGTKRLKDIHKEKLKEIKEKRALFSNRVHGNDELDEATMARYYSKWYYAAIHIIVTIPEYKTKEDISNYLGLKMEVVNEAIQFLESTGLISHSMNGYATGKTKVFLKEILPSLFNTTRTGDTGPLILLLKGRKKICIFLRSTPYRNLTSFSSKKSYSNTFKR